MTDREACIVLNMISGVGYVRYRKLCDAFGSPAAALEQPAEILQQLPGLGAKLAEIAIPDASRRILNMIGNIVFVARAV